MYWRISNIRCTIASSPSLTTYAITSVPSGQSHTIMQPLICIHSPSAGTLYVPSNGFIVVCTIKPNRHAIWCQQTVAILMLRLFTFDSVWQMKCGAEFSFPVYQYLWSCATASPSGVPLWPKVMLTRLYNLGLCSACKKRKAPFKQALDKDSDIFPLAWFFTLDRI